MDSQRSQLRRNFTNCINKLKAALEDKDFQSTKILYRQLQDKSQRLFEADKIKLESFQNASEEELEKEWETVEAYRDQLSEINVRYEEFVGREEPVSKEVNTQRLLPKIQLQEFDLEPRNYLSFWAQFQPIHEEQKLRELDKLQYLKQCLSPGTKARNIVDGYPPCKENYIKAISQIQNRFGKDTLLLDIYTRDILTLLLNKEKYNLIDLYDTLNTQLQALATLGVTTNNCAAILYPLVESCLPLETLKHWQRFRNTRNTNDTCSSLNVTVSEEDNVLTCLMEFLKIEVSSEERVTLAQKAFKEDPLSTATSLVSTETKSKQTQPVSKIISCGFCSKTNHVSVECFAAQKMTTQQKREKLKENKACVICLRKGHSDKFCRSKVKCLICEGRHLYIMCPNKNNKINKNESKTLTGYSRTNEQILLQTLTAELVNSFNRTVKVRILCDTGSQNSYIQDKLALLMKLDVIGNKEVKHSLFGGVELKQERHKIFKVTLKSVKYNTYFSFHAMGTNNICNDIPRLTKEECTSLLGPEWDITDVGQEEAPVDILLGADYFGQLLTGEIRQVKNLCLMNTKLGWMVMGNIKRNSNRSVCVLNLLTKDINDLWQLEVLGIKDPIEIKTKEENNLNLLKKFNLTTKLNKEGHYEVELPFKEGDPYPKSNLKIAENRLNSITNKLKKSGMFENYNQVLLQWENDKIIEKVKDFNFDEGQNIFYLPHRPIYKENSTTKTRPVFDASSQDSNGVCLNSCLETGPNLIEKIPKILAGFRMKNIGVIADIKQAFCQVSVVENNRDVLRFLWWEKDKIIAYRHTRVPFGLTCSPFLLGATLHYHFEKLSDQLETKAQLLQSFYVDNCVTSLDDIKSYKTFVEQAIEILKKGKFDLRGWCSNIENFENNAVESVLGLLWDRKTDTLSCDLKTILKEIKVCTKRTLLSKAQAIFDPIGFTAPATLALKLLVQEAMIENKNRWDHQISKSIEEAFKLWMSSVLLLEQVKVPRHIGLTKNSKYEVHIFVDASQKAFAACAFLRINNEFNVKIQLMMAKSRVAPIKNKKLSIPRLELLGAILGIRLGNTIKTFFPEGIKITYWSDSMVTLWWIKKQGKWNVFVKNRIKEIQQFSNIDQWRYIQSENNPADLPSRSCSPAELLKSQWWYGPKWLYNSEIEWPKKEIEYCSEIENEVVKTTTCLVNFNVEEQRIMSYFSKYSMIIRTLAWIFRFYNNAKGNKARGPLKVEEIEKAEIVLIKLVQSDTKIEDNYKNFQLFKCEQGLIRIVSRVTSNTTESHLILLPAKHIFVTRMVEQIHRDLHHAGVAMTLNKVRERFWLSKGRQTIKKILYKCVKCKRIRGKNIKPIPTGLPLDRTKISATCFEICGVDATGPIILKDGSKIWILLFTCAIFRAVHFEIIKNMSTDCFILALRRFLARRNRVQKIYSDHGSNFEGARNLLESIDWTKVSEFSSSKRVEWTMIPPKAPFYGGWYERLFGILKNLLRKTLGKAALTEDEFTTLTIEVENIMNNRPLTYDSDEVTALRPLTPNHFLSNSIFSDMSPTEEWDIIDHNTLNRRTRYIASIREQLKIRFKQEYLSLLLQLKGKPGYKIQIGDVVLIEDENRKRVLWPLGQIIQVYPGNDGEVRVVKVKTSKGELVRPVQKIYPLEIRENLKVSELRYEKVDEKKDNTETSKIATVDKIVSRKGREIIKPKRLDL